MPPKWRRESKGFILILELGGARVRNPVATVSMTVGEVLSAGVGVTAVGEKEHVAAAGKPLELSATA